MHNAIEMKKESELLSFCTGFIISIYEKSN